MSRFRSTHKATAHGFLHKRDFWAIYLEEEAKGLPFILRLYNIEKISIGFAFQPHCVACGILVPWPGIKPGAPAMRILTLNHWASREFPRKPPLLISKRRVGLPKDILDLRVLKSLSAGRAPTVLTGFSSARWKWAFECCSLNCPLSLQWPPFSLISKSCLTFQLAHVHFLHEAHLWDLHPRMSFPFCMFSIDPDLCYPEQQEQ